MRPSKWNSEQYPEDLSRHQPGEIVSLIDGGVLRAKHIKVRFFWLKDLIDGGEIILVYVSSEELVADMLTKATTGAKFKYLRVVN